MKKAVLQPTAEDSYRMVYDPASRGETYEQTLRRALRQEAGGDIQGACNTRFDAFQSIAEIIPEDDEVILDWEDTTNRSALAVINMSAIDHFLAGDFEMAAAMWEMMLDLDPEDHLEAIKRLAYCYVALEEYELFDEVAGDLGEKSPEKELLVMWAALRRDGAIPRDALARFAKGYPVYFKEFTAPEHPATEEYMADIDRERPAPGTLARALWIETEHLWALFPGFIEALKG